jgi:hypothetical protein
MNNKMPSINLRFDDYSESFYLIKFSKREYLEQIKHGKIRFRHIGYWTCSITRLVIEQVLAKCSTFCFFLSRSCLITEVIKQLYYQNYENVNNNNVIGDKYEGLESISYPSDKLSFYFSHHLINNGNSIDITKSIVGQFCNYQSNNTYIFCLSYFSAKDIREKTIFDEAYLKEKDFEYVLLILDSCGFVENITRALSVFNPIIQKITYIDYMKNQRNLNVFTKSLTYSWQKEIRIAVELHGDNCDNVKRLSDDTIEVSFEPAQCVILPAKSFREGFAVEQRDGDDIVLSREKPNA